MMEEGTGEAPAVDSGNVEATPDIGNVAETPAVQDSGNAVPELTREMVQGSEFFKELQSDHTKKSQRNKDMEGELAQYQQALQDPLRHGITIPQMKQYLQMNGYDMRQLEQQQEDAYGDNSQVNQDAQILQKIAPYDQRVRSLEANLNKLVQGQVVSELNAKFPDWLKYEDDIKDNLKRYPHLGETSEGIDTLHDMCVPPAQKEAAIRKQIQAEMDGKRDLSNATLPAASTPKAEAPDGDFTGDWEGAWNWAKKQHGL